MQAALDSNVQPSPGIRSACYGALPLVELASHISLQGDRLALREFHDNRPVFRLRDGQPMLFIRFVSALRESRWAKRMAGCDDAVLDKACDVIIDRFTRLPPDNPPPASEGVSGGTAGPDCRHYFRGFLQAWENRRKDKPPLSILQEETAAACVFQRGVVKHFRLACQEAGRTSNPTRSRYAWRVNDRVIYVWMPRRLPGSQKRTWLKTHVADVDPDRPGERERIQAMVDAYFGVTRVFSIDDVTAGVLAGTSLPGSSGQDGQAGEVAFDLPQYVAREKAQTINQQRRTIRALGPERLQALVLEILRLLPEGDYNEADLAERFGPSESTLSRFAGKDWQKTKGIPDLWANTARVLAAHPPFVEAAKETGVWETVKLVLRNAPRSRARRIDDV